METTSEGQAVPTSATHLLGCCGRREALRAVGVVAVAGAGLTACGSEPDKAVGEAVSDAASSAAGAAKDLAKKADIPVGGGKVFDSAKVVVTQPTEGDYKAFSAVCTHQGCNVSEVRDGTINCPCHGSRYSITDGSVVRRPAQEPLPTYAVTRTGDFLTIS